MHGSQRAVSRPVAAQVSSSPVASAASKGSEGSGATRSGGAGSGAPAGTAGDRAAAAPGGAAARRVDGKAPDSGRAPAAKAPQGRPHREKVSGSDAKSLEKRVAREVVPAAADRRHRESQQAVPVASAAPVQAPDPHQEYRQAVRLLEEFYARERSSIPPGYVASIEHYFSYGETAIARSLIARFVEQSEAASGEGGNPRLLDAATRVLNDFD